MGVPKDENYFRHCKCLGEVFLDISSCLSSGVICWQASCLGQHKDWTPVGLYVRFRVCDSPFFLACDVFHEVVTLYQKQIAPAKAIVEANDDKYE